MTEPPSLKQACEDYLYSLGHHNFDGCVPKQMIDDLMPFATYLAQRQLADRCDKCGTKLNLTGCVVCGAPQCCPSCCNINSLKMKLAAVTQERDHFKEANQGLIDSQKISRAEWKTQLQAREATVGELNERLQNVIGIRDYLLTAIYKVLDKPNGILLHEMDAAIASQRAAITRLEARIKELENEP